MIRINLLSSGRAKAVAPGFQAGQKMVLDSFVQGAG